MVRIYLIGFMGSGKTFTGRQLATGLGWSFLDLDDLIEREAGTDIPTIFQQSGEPEFRRLERRALHSTGEMKQVVISTGGGAPCHFDNMQWINQHGLSIFLDAPVDILTQRLLPERAHRPLLQQYDEASLPAFIEAKLAERAYFYQQADIIYRQLEPAGEIVPELLTIINGKRKT